MPRRTATRAKARRTSISRRSKRRTATRKTATTGVPTQKKQKADWLVTETWKGANNLYRQWQGWATRFAPQELVNMAQSHKAAWERDIVGFANNVANMIRHTSDLIPNGEHLINDTRRNLNTMVNMVKHSSWYRTVRDIAQAGKDDLLAKLNIPSQTEVEDLQRKLATLEQRLTTVMLRGAKNR
jgi:hypothetical protein